MFLTLHAIQRFQDRVAAVGAAEAAEAIRRAAAHARVRPKPRWWTPVEPSPGLLFLYPPSLPGVCFLVRQATIVTVFERSQCRRWTAQPVQSSRAMNKRRPRRPESWLEDAA